MVIKALVLVPLALYAFFGITVMSIFFGYFNQSSLTPPEQRLNFVNYLLPYFLTIGFIIYCAYDLINSGRKKYANSNVVKVVLFVAAAVIAIPWQLKHINWSTYLGDMVPYLIGVLFTIVTVIFQLTKFIKTKTANNSSFKK